MAVIGARTFYHLPYFNAAMRMNATASGGFDYHSNRADSRGSAARLDASLRPTGPAMRGNPGSLEHFLTERYCLYSVGDGERLYRAEIHHEPWPLQPAQADFRENSMTSAAGISVDGPPAQLSFAREIDVVVWWPNLVNPS